MWAIVARLRYWLPRKNDVYEQVRTMDDNYLAKQSSWVQWNGVYQMLKQCNFYYSRWLPSHSGQEWRCWNPVDIYCARGHLSCYYNCNAGVLLYEASRGPSEYQMEEGTYREKTTVNRKGTKENSKKHYNKQAKLWIKQHSRHEE